MGLPDPAPGLVIGFSYLWRNEALRGGVEGRKDRPCVIILSVRTEAGRVIVTVAPITHVPPVDPDMAVEIPKATKQRLGLDGSRSWIVVADLNQFVWPGADLRPIRRDARSFVHGLLPAGFYREVRDRVLKLAQQGRVALTSRDE